MGAPLNKNPYARQTRQYKQAQVETATQEEILLLLYDGAIRFLVQANKALEKNDVEAFHNNLLKTQDIVMEFMTSLDMEVGGEVAKNLFALYEYLHYRLVQANIKKDATMVDEVLAHLRDLRKTWDEAIRIAAREKTADRCGADPSNDITDTRDGDNARTFSA